MKPKRGALAICEAGTLGLITSNQVESITYLSVPVNAWLGIHLTDTPVIDGEPWSKIGDPWSSRNPRVIGYLA